MTHLASIALWVQPKIMNKSKESRTGVANVSEKIREARRICLGHVERKTEEDVMRTWKWVDTER